MPVIMSESNQGERLQKVLATLGLGSRRSIEEWIRDGRVAVNGRRAELGVRVGPKDLVELDGRAIDLGGSNAAAASVVLGYHKPLGEVTTRSDPQGRPTVFERLPAPPNGRWIVVGRLDVNTSGLLLFTTDGELAHRLMHPSSEVEREYLVRVRSLPAAATLDTLRRGVNSRTAGRSSIVSRRSMQAMDTRGFAWCYTKDATAKCGDCGVPRVTRSVV